MQRRKELWVLVGAIAVSIILIVVPFGRLVLYPFSLFNTWIHEMSHGLMAIAMGASFKELTLRADTSGLAQYAFNPEQFGAVKRAMVASSGYLGSALFGGALLALRRFRSLTKPLLYAIGVVMLLSVLLWVRNLFGIIAVLVMGMLLVTAATKLAQQYAYLLLTFLAVQMAFNSVESIYHLYKIGASQRTDAQTMAQLFLLPGWFWSFLWFALALVFLYIGWRLSRPKQGSTAPVEQEQAVEEH